MNVLEDIRFEKSLPRENKEQILSKIGEFIRAWGSSIDPTELNRRFSVKKVQGDTVLPEVWKFKVSDGNRVLFTKGKSLNLEESGYEDALILLMFCNHDAQIVKARQLSKVMPVVEAEAEGLESRHNSIGTDTLTRAQNDADEYIEEQIQADEMADEAANQKAARLHYDPETSITRVFKHIGIEALVDLERLQGIYYLNKNQRECVNADYRPLILFGSAGSGKTTIGVYKLIDLIKQNPHIKVGYFTYSNKLAQSAKQIFDIVLENELEVEEAAAYKSQVDFYNLRDWLKKETKTDYMVQYDQFNEQFFIPMRQNLAMNPEYKEVILKLTGYEAWREIRGLIKGYAGDKWQPHLEGNGLLSESEYIRLSQQHSFYNEAQRKVLYALALKYLEWQKAQGAVDENDLCRALLCKNQILQQAENEKGSLSSYSYESRNDLKAAKENSGEDCEEGTVGSCGYSSGKYKNVAAQYGEKLYKDTRYKAMGYQDGTGYETNQYGERQLPEEQYYDWIVIDEVQDLTELEIYLLQTRVKEAGNFLLSGDYHQTIAPTYFNTKRIMTLLEHHDYRDKEDANCLVLTHNYRNPRQVVELANRLSHLRKQLFGKDKRNDYSEEIAMCETEGNLYTLCGNRSEKMKLLKEAVEKAYVYIVVATDKEKAELEEALNNKIRIFTVYEVKGLENKYIIGVNLLSSFKAQWEVALDYIGSTQDIEESGGDTVNAKSNTPESYLYRYMMNMVYVTLTRAQENLCLIEDEVDASFIEALFHTKAKDSEVMVQNESTFNAAVFGLDESSSAEDFYLEAQKFEEAEQYERALAQYEKLHMPKAKRRASFCQGKLHEANGRFLEAGECYEAAKELKWAAQAYKKAKAYAKYYACFIKWNEELFWQEIILNEEISYEREIAPYLNEDLKEKIKALALAYYHKKLKAEAKEKELAIVCAEVFDEDIQAAMQKL